MSNPLERIKPDHHWREIIGLPKTYIKLLGTHRDERGSLTELMRIDELPEHWPEGETKKAEDMVITLDPAPSMGYLSWTREGVVRGPHEHVNQWDYFAFVGPGMFELHLWDNRQPPGDEGYHHRHYLVGDPGYSEAKPCAVVVPPGVVHGYKCVSTTSDWGGLVMNLPSHLYKGWLKKDAEVDEIRHELDPDSPFKIE